MLTEAIIELVKANLGLAGLARWAVAPQLQSGALVALPLRSRSLQRQWSAVMLRHQARAGHVEAFVDLIARRGPGTRIPAKRAKS